VPTIRSRLFTRPFDCRLRAQPCGKSRGIAWEIAFRRGPAPAGQGGFVDSPPTDRPTDRPTDLGLDKTGPLTSTKLLQKGDVDRANLETTPTWSLLPSLGTSDSSFICVVCSRTGSPRARRSLGQPKCTRGSGLRLSEVDRVMGGRQPQHWAVKRGRALGSLRSVESHRTDLYLYLNSSPRVKALVPFGVVTMTCTVPLPGGAFTEILVNLLLVPKIVAGRPPKVTAVGSTKPEPLILTVLPPALGPVFGETMDTSGCIEPDHGPLSVLGVSCHVPEAAVPEAFTVPLNVSPVMAAVTDQPPEQEMEPAASEVKTPGVGDVKTIVKGPEMANGAFL
jgi:hypothetical protein